MNHENALRMMWLIIAVMCIGGWLAGILDLPVHVGRHVLGRHTGVDESETAFSIVGWILLTFSAFAMIALLYRQRAKR